MRKPRFESLKCRFVYSSLSKSHRNLTKEI